MIVNVPILFNSVDVNTVTGLQVTDVDPYASPKRALTTYPLAEADKEVTTSVRYRSRRILIRVVINRNTKALMEESLDTLEGIFRLREKTLELDVAGLRRQFTATMSNFTPFDANGGFCKVDIELICADPFGYDRSYTTLDYVTGNTNNNRTASFTVPGNVSQLPRIILTLASLTSGTNKTIMIKDMVRGSSISVLRTWVAGDKLEIDAAAGTVKVNGVEVSYSGAFPEFEPGSNYIFYQDEFTARNYAQLIQFRRRYL